MILIQEWNQMLFLACPIMKDLSNLMWSGLFVNELSMHDYSRDIMLAQSQQSIEMRMALANAEKRSAQCVAQLKRPVYVLLSNSYLDFIQILTR